jgi:hypothetical protein
MVMHPVAHAHAPPRSQHNADLPARSTRRTYLLHTATARLLVPARPASSRAKLHAVAYACSSRQYRGHTGISLRSKIKLQQNDYHSSCIFLVSSKLHLVTPMFLCTKLQCSQLHLFVVKFQQRKKTRKKG